MVRKFLVCLAWHWMGDLSSASAVRESLHQFVPVQARAIYHKPMLTLAGVTELC